MKGHVAIIIPGLDRIGGAEQQVILLAKGLLRRGWRVSVVMLSGNGGKAAADLTAIGIECACLGMRKGLADPRGWIRFHQWLRRERPEVVHAHLPHAAWLARWSRLLAPVRVLIDTLHSSSTGNLGRKLGYRWSRGLPDRVTAVSRAVAAAHASAGMVEESKIIVIPNGVDIENWRADVGVREMVRQESGFGNEFLWFAAGRLEKVKDYPTMLRAMAGLPETSSLVIAGAGHEEGTLRRICSELGLEQRVRFLGFESNVLRWMQAADGFVLSSRWEGLPMALLEAAACALPAVATEVPGSREVVLHGETGFLAAPGSSFALQEAMARTMLMQAEGRRAMGEQARSNAVKCFSLEMMLDRWEELYTSLLDRNPVPMRWGALKL